MAAMNRKKLSIIFLILLVGIGTLSADFEFFFEYGDTPEEAQEHILQDLHTRISEQLSAEYRSIVVDYFQSQGRDVEEELLLFDVFPVHNFEFGDPTEVEGGGYYVSGMFTYDSKSFYQQYIDSSLRFIEALERELATLRSPLDDSSIEEYLAELLEVYEEYDFATLMLALADDEIVPPKPLGTKADAAKRYARFLHRNDWVVELSADSKAQLNLMREASANHLLSLLPGKSVAQEYEDYLRIQDEYETLRQGVIEKTNEEFQPRIEGYLTKIEEIRTKAYRPAELVDGVPTAQAVEVRNQEIEEVFDQGDREWEDIYDRHNAEVQDQVDGYTATLQSVKERMEAQVYAFSDPWTRVFVEQYDPEAQGWRIEIGVSYFDYVRMYQWLVPYNSITGEAVADGSDRAAYNHYLEQVDLFNAFLLGGTDPLFLEYRYTIEVGDDGYMINELDYTLYRTDTNEVLLTTKEEPVPAVDLIEEEPIILEEEDLLVVQEKPKNSFDFNKYLSSDQRTFDAFFNFDMLFKEMGTNDPNKQFFQPEVGVDFFLGRFFYAGGSVGFTEKPGGDGFASSIYLNAGATAPFELGTLLISPYLETSIGVSKQADTFLTIGAAFTTHRWDELWDTFENGFTVKVGYKHALGGPHAGFGGFTVGLAYSNFWR